VTKKSAPPTVASVASVKPVVQALGKVLGLDGKPTPGVQVRGYIVSDQGSSVISNNGGNFKLLASAAPEVLETTTDAEGNFNLSLPAGKRLNIEAVRSEDLKAIKQEVAEGARGLELQLAYTGTIRGKVTTPKAPQVTNHGGVDVYVPGTGYVAKTDDDGSYTLDHVPVGTFRLAAEKAGLGSARVTGVKVESKATVAAPDLALDVAPPQLTAISPPMGGPGAEVTLTGERFAASSGGTFTVSFGGALAANPKRIDDRTIKAVVPPSAGSGDVVVAVQDIPSNGQAFTVLKTLQLPSTIRDLRVGATESYLALATDSAEKPVVAPVVTWKAEGSAFTVDEAGKVSAKAAGEGKLTVSSGSLTGSLVIKVADGPVVTTLAGSTPSGPPSLKDGPGEQVSFLQLSGIRLLPSGELLVGDGTTVRKISPAGYVETLAGGVQAGNLLGTGKDAQFGLILDLLARPDGNIVVADYFGLLRNVSPEGTSTAFAGKPNPVGPGAPAPVAVDGKGENAVFLNPSQLALAEDGTIYVADHTRIRAIRPDGTVSSLTSASPLSPTPNYVPTEGPAADQSFLSIGGMALVGQSLYIVDAKYVRKLDLSAPGLPVKTLPVKLAPGAMSFNLAADPRGGLFISQPSFAKIGHITDTSMEPEPFAGGSDAGNQDGLLEKATFSTPYQMVATKTHLYVSDPRGGRVRRIDIP
jgi:hypothetical protein